MIIRYTQISPQHRDIVRALENRGHISYIRFLMLKRWTMLSINQELFKLGLSGDHEENLWVYFKEALLPILQTKKLNHLYAEYRPGKVVSSLCFENSLGKNETQRIQFLYLIKELDVDLFFLPEIVKYYGSVKLIPIDSDTGYPIIEAKYLPDFVSILNHPKRMYIEMMLAEGKTPKMIREYFSAQYDEVLPEEQISFFSRAFFNIKRKDLERTIETFQYEIASLETMLTAIRTNQIDWLQISERAHMVASIKFKIQNLQNIIKRLSGFHHHAAYQAGVLEFTHIKDMFADVLVRTHRRFIETDRRTEDDAVNVLNTVVNMMAKATDKFLNLDDKLSEKGRKTVSEEMLEVVMPTAERVLEEERNAMLQYHREFGSELPPPIQTPERDEIIGMDD